MARVAHKKKRSLKSKFMRFIVINMIPVTGLVALGWGLNQGKIPLDSLPGGVGRNALYFGVAIALLIVATSFFLPLVHGIARHFATTLGWSSEVRKDCGAARKLWEFACWLPRQLTYRIMVVLRSGFILVSLALILCSVVFMIRMVKPDFLEDKLDVTARMVQAEEIVRDFKF